MESNRREFLTRLFTGVVVAGASGKVLGQIIPRISETPNPNIIQAEFVVDLTLSKYAALANNYSSVSINGTGVTSAAIIVMRIPTDKFVALENRCSHESGILGSFNSSNKRFTCSLHSAQFNENGVCVSTGGSGASSLSALTTFPVTYDKTKNQLILNRLTDVSDLTPDSFMVRCYPNPAVTDTAFEFALEKDGLTTLELFDERGVHVTTIFNEFRQAGSHQVVFNVESLASGSYTYRLVTQDGFATSRQLSVVH